MPCLLRIAPDAFSPRPWGCTVIFTGLQHGNWVFPTPVGVYRKPLRLPEALPSFPHARGGVPIGSRSAQAGFTFSPRPWGCTVPAGYEPQSARRFPHARGGVPVATMTMRGGNTFSPRPWGCTVQKAKNELDNFVFPTPVGVYRRGRPGLRPAQRFPHARGGVPAGWPPAFAHPAFSPRPWGCTVLIFVFIQIPAVFPTPVGVYRGAIQRHKFTCRFPHARGGVPQWRREPATPKRFPHARGGVPTMCFCAYSPQTFSPRPWGCTAAPLRLYDSQIVFPTPVGVYRAIRVSTARADRFPHARGGVPSAVMSAYNADPFSPRPWGCTATRRTVLGCRRVFPTPVGVYRRWRLRSDAVAGFPHARGGVPRRRTSFGLIGPFSPRPWGCTARYVLSLCWLWTFSPRPWGCTEHLKLCWN